MRIVSLSPSNTEILYALGLEDELVGVTAYCDYPAAAKEKPHVGGWTTASVAQVEALKPDLVLTSTFLQQPLVGQLRKRSLNVCHLNPTDLASVAQSIRRIGTATRRKTKAHQLADFFEHELNHMRTQWPPLATKPRILVIEWEDPLTPSGNWVPEMVKLAGGMPVLAQGGRRSTPVLPHAVRDCKAETVVVSICGKGVQANLAQLAAHPYWSHLPAVAHNRVHVVSDSLFNCPAFRLLEGIRTLREIIQTDFAAPQTAT